MTHARQESVNERGAVLILALVFLLAIALVTVATAALAVNSNANTSNARQQQLSQANVESEVSLAIQTTRVTYNYGGCASNCYATPPAFPALSSQTNCTPGSGAVGGLSVWCVGSGGSNYGFRTVDFYVCKSGVSPCAGSTKVALFAEVVYQDVPAGEAQTNDECSSLSTATCGITMSITSWDARLADS